MTRVQVFERGYFSTDNPKVEYEGNLMKTMTHIYGDYASIKSKEMALIQLDNGTFRTAEIDLIKLKK